MTYSPHLPIGVTVEVDIDQNLSFDPDTLEKGLYARGGWHTSAQCDHMSYIRVHFDHVDFALIQTELRTFAAHLAKELPYHVTR